MVVQALQRGGSPGGQDEAMSGDNRSRVEVVICARGSEHAEFRQRMDGCETRLRPVRQVSVHEGSTSLDFSQS